MKADHNLCCDAMNSAITEEKIIEYDMVDRSYGILFGKRSIRMLNFCPWCGNKLGKILNNEIFSVLENEYGIKKEKADIYNFTNIPEEFWTDEWWKKRGL